ncbi:MAG: hypothetical protein R6W06_02695 [Prochlorococcaceae cyanobacterium]
MGSILSPRRWPVHHYSDWNRALRRGRVTLVPLGPVGHELPRRGAATTSASSPTPGTAPMPPAIWRPCPIRASSRGRSGSAA